MAISNTRLSTSALTSVYISSGNNAITTIIACNTGTPNITDETVNASTLTLYFIPKDGVASDSTTVIKNVIVPAGETIFFSDEKVILSDGDFISATAGTGNLITMTVSALPV